MEAGSDSSSAEEQEDISQAKGDNSSKLPNPLSLTLPSVSNSLDKVDEKASVFTNRFDIAEKEKNAILEKHVKMTEARILTGKDAKICFKFRKGKCRFGKSCKYSHDLESNSISNQSSQSADSSHKNKTPRTNFNNFNTFDSGFPSSSNRMYTQSNYGAIPEFGMPLPPEPVDDDNYMATAKRKKRCGVSDHLLPPKKAMMALDKQRQEERPWTVNK